MRSLRRVKASYPIIWKNKDAKPELCFVGCPHMSVQQLKDWTDAIEEKAAAQTAEKGHVPTVFTALPAVIKALNGTVYLG